MKHTPKLHHMHDQPECGREYLIWYFDVAENYAFCHSYTAPDNDKNQPNPDIKVLGWQYIETPLEAIRERLKEMHQEKLEAEYWDTEARRWPL